MASGVSGLSGRSAGDIRGVGGVGGGVGSVGGMRRKPPKLGSPTMRQGSVDKLSNLGLGGLVAASPGPDVVVVSGTSSSPVAAAPVGVAALVVSVWNSREDGEGGKGDFLGCVTLPAYSLVDPTGEVTTYDLVPDNALNVVNGKKLRLVQVSDLSRLVKFTR